MNDENKTRAQLIEELTELRGKTGSEQGNRVMSEEKIIRKPVDFEQFSEAIRQVGLYWLVLNEAPPRGKE